ncbi:hypothetical protein DPMN_090136 [Dreissena polymorpha]|uniref:Uncharacterized protein n=1 Tax=Dreissena polymorpha TaxID=45954 RepID=A0A9D4KXM6_DREPO|nr:hypothetical protein DPMN_090136 [Dreissena polymorpha]
MVRDTTCACSNCPIDKGFIWSENNVCGWRKEILSKTEEDYQNKAAENVAFENEDFVPAYTQHSDRENECDTVEEEITKEEFVAAKYDGETYIGKVLNIDEGLFEIIFIEHGKKSER